MGYEFHFGTPPSFLFRTRKWPYRNAFSGRRAIFSLVLLSLRAGTCILPFHVPERSEKQQPERETMAAGLRIFCLCALFALALGDTYLHNPRGSNNRLNERSANRNNANRLFNSQVSRARRAARLSAVIAVNYLVTTFGARAPFTLLLPYPFPSRRTTTEEATTLETKTQVPSTLRSRSTTW